MEIAEFFRRRLAYQDRANSRDIEKANNGMNFDEDIPHYAKVTDEMLIDLIERVEKIERLYADMPDAEEKPDSRIKIVDEKPAKKRLSDPPLNLSIS